MARVALYCRQSDSDGAGEESLSLESQEAAMRERAAREGWVVIAVEREADVRGWQDEEQRPAFSRLLARARRREYDVLLFWDASRFARSVRLQEMWVYELAGYGVRCVSHTEGHFDGDPTFRQIIGAINERRSREISGHIKRVQEHRASVLGLPNGKLPFGYRRAENGEIEADPERAALVVELNERYAAGESAVALVREFRQRGAPSLHRAPWSMSSFRYIIANPTYRGFIPFRGELHPSSLPVLVDDKLAEAVDRMAERRRFRRAPKNRNVPVSWLDGLVVHSCGRPGYCIRIGQSRVQVRCQPELDVCGHYPRSISLRYVEPLARKAVIEAFAALPADALTRAEHRAVSLNARAVSERQRLLDARDNAKRRLERLARLALDADMDETWYAARRRDILAERDGIERDLAALPSASDLTLLAEAHAEVAALSNADLLARADDPAFWAALMQRLGWVEFGERGIRIVWREPFNLLFGCAENR